MIKNTIIKKTTTAFASGNLLKKFICALLLTKRDI